MSRVRNSVLRKKDENTKEDNGDVKDEKMERKGAQEIKGRVKNET